MVKADVALCLYFCLGGLYGLYEASVARISGELYFWIFSMMPWLEFPIGCGLLWVCLFVWMCFVILV